MVEVDKFSEGLARYLCYSNISQCLIDVYAYRVSIVNYNGQVVYDVFVKPEG